MLPRLTVKQVSRVSGIPASTLYGWARDYDDKPVGPRPRRLGPGVIRYAPEDVAQWLDVPVEPLTEMAVA